jgi:hypothetical protein
MSTTNKLVRHGDCKIGKNASTAEVDDDQKDLTHAHWGLKHKERK